MVARSRWHSRLVYATVIMGHESRIRSDYWDTTLDCFSSRGLCTVSLRSAGARGLKTVTTDYLSISLAPSLRGLRLVSDRDGKNSVLVFRYVLVLCSTVTPLAINHKSGFGSYTFEMLTYARFELWSWEVWSCWSVNSWSQQNCAKYISTIRQNINGRWSNKSHLGYVFLESLISHYRWARTLHRTLH